MTKTVPHPYGSPVLGYVLNTQFTQESQQTIVGLQNQFQKQFGGVLHVDEPGALHITLMDWLAPLVEYGRDKDKIFIEIYEAYDKAIQESISGIAPIRIEFNQINISPNAIFLSGKDKGQYQRIRERFLNKADLLPNTKMPPKIIHTTIARYTEEVDLEPIIDFAGRQSINFSHTTREFRLLRTVGTSLESKKTIKLYKLENSQLKV